MVHACDVHIRILTMFKRRYFEDNRLHARQKRQKRQVRHERRHLTACGTAYTDHTQQRQGEKEDAVFNGNSGKKKGLQHLVFPCGHPSQY